MLVKCNKGTSVHSTLHAASFEYNGVKVARQRVRPCRSPGRHEEADSEDKKGNKLRDVQPQPPSSLDLPLRKEAALNIP